MTPLLGTRDAHRGAGKSVQRDPTDSDSRTQTNATGRQVTTGHRATVPQLCPVHARLPAPLAVPATAGPLWPESPVQEKGALPDTPEASALRPRAGGPRTPRGTRVSGLWLAL